MLLKNEMDLIISHLENGNKSSGCLIISILAKSNPEYIKNVSAFRALLCSKKDLNDFKYTLEEGDSFSLKKESIDQFLKDVGVENQAEESALIIHADITCYDLGLFLREQIENFPEKNHEIIESFIDENEVLMISLNKIIDEYSFK